MARSVFPLVPRLTPAPASLLGRGHDLASIHDALAPGTPLTLVGPAGVGKTALARATYDGWAESRRAWADLQTIGDPASVLDLLGHLVTDDPREGHRLVVLDGCERVGPAPAIARWLEARPWLLVLATSRVSSRLAGEATYPIAGLATPDAVALYRSVSRRSRGRAPSREEAALGVAGLEGNPLAIALAASRTGVTTGARESAVVRAGRASLVCATPAARRAYGRLGVTTGVVREETARALAGTGYALDELEDLGLIERSGTGLVAIPGALRPLAAGLLSDAERAGAERELVAHFASVGESLNEHAGDRARLAASLATEIDTVLRAVEHAEGVARLACARVAVGALLHVGPYRRGLRVAAEALAQEEGAPPCPARVHLEILRASLETCLGRLPEAEAAGRRALTDARALAEPTCVADALDALALVALRAHDLDAAAAHVEEGLSVTGAAQPVRVSLLGRRARVHLERLEGAEARDALIEVLAFARHHGNEASAAVSELNLGVAALIDGDLEEGELRLQAGLRYYRATGYPRGEAYCLHDLASIALERGDPSEASALLVDALDAARRVGERHMESKLRVLLGLVYADMGALDEARVELERALLLSRGEAPQLNFAAHALAARSILAASRGEMEESARSLAEARELAPDAARLQEVLAVAAAHLALARSPNSASARDRAERVRDAPGSSDARCAARALARLLEDAARPAAAAAAIEVAPDGSWFRTGPDEPHVDLRRRKALRAVLAGLARELREPQTEGLTVLELFAIGWPSELAHPDAAAQRVYTAIWSLRRLGLEGALARIGDGYRLEPGLVRLGPSRRDRNAPPHPQ